MKLGLGPGNIVLDGDPVGTQPPTAAPPHFWRMPIVAKRSPISATAELLFSLFDPDLRICTMTAIIFTAQHIRVRVSLLNTLAAKQLNGSIA